MNNLDYARISGYLRVLEKRLLKNDIIDRIIDSPDAGEAAKAIAQNSEYDFSAFARPEDYERVINAALKKTYKSLYKIAPDKYVMDIILAKYDFHNLKAALKSKCLGKNDDRLYTDYTEINPVWITDFILKGAKPDKQLPAHLVEAAASAASAYEENGSPQSIDIALDSHMFEHQRRLADASDNGFLKEYVRFTIDFYNVTTMLRVKNMSGDLKFLKDILCGGGKVSKAVFIENFDKDITSQGDVFQYKYFGGIMRMAVEAYEKTGNLSGLEKLMDNFILEHVKKSKLVSFGPEILMSYIFSKENEARQVRIIMACKINNIPPEVLRERLRDNYA